MLFGKVMLGDKQVMQSSNLNKGLLKTGFITSPNEMREFKEFIAANNKPRKIKAKEVFDALLKPAKYFKSTLVEDTILLSEENSIIKMNYTKKLSSNFSKTNPILVGIANVNRTPGKTVTESLQDALKRAKDNLLLGLNTLNKEKRNLPKSQLKELLKKHKVIVLVK